jgi:cytochrome P450 family 135
VPQLFNRYAWKTAAVTAAASLPPGPRAPRALQTARWLARPTAMMEDCARRYGDMFTLKIANEAAWVFVTDPDVVKEIFRGDPRLLHAGEANVVLLPVLGSHSVLLLDEDAHMAQRKLMLPSFHGERMRGYEQTMAEVAAREIDRWPAGEPLSAWPTMQAITLEVIMRTVFGVTDSERLQRLGDVLRSSLSWATDPRRLARLAVLGPRRVAEQGALKRALKPTDDLIFEEIRSRRDAPDLEQREDVLSLLLQARHDDGSPMSDQELRDELMTLLVAGHETSATALAWALEALSRHPAALNRLRDEVDADDADDADPYLDAVVQETLRLRPVIALVLRRLTEPMEIGGRLLPAGVNVAPCIYLMHRRPDVYDEPRAFRPERFLEQPPGTYTWIPFGGGVRRCLGASFAQFEIKVVLRELVARLEIRPARPQPERRVRRAIVFAPERGGELVVERRARRSGSTEGAGETVPQVFNEYR